MLSLIEQIKNGALWDFPGGVHPPENKTQSTSTHLAWASIPQEIVLPIKQHIGKPGILLVAVGDEVKKGQPLTRYDTNFSVPVHAPTSGVITAIENRTTAHPSGLRDMCVVIKPDFKDTWIERSPVTSLDDHTPDELIEMIRQAGVSGMGGAGFPTGRKVQSGLSRVEMLIVNAAECEPYITADDALIREHAEEIVAGIEVVEHILKPKLTIIGIEDNKPQAIEALERATENKDIVIRVVPTKYPSGGAKQLIKLLTNKEIPSGQHSADIGMVVLNVGTLQAIKSAIYDGEPSIRRVVTLTGNTFKQPRNVWALIGTSVQDLLDEFGYQPDKKLPRLIMGGPMMGFTLPHANVPITKISNCILAPTRKEIAPARHEMACIRCGDCAEVCPASLLPQQLQWYAKAKDYDKCEELDLKDCIECGACAYVCPSEIPLVQYYRQAKAEIRAQKWEAEAAERARQRFEEKKARMERDKAERENRFKKAAEDRRKEMKSSSGDDAIAAAIARVKSQKATSTDGEPQVKPAVAAAIAKAKAKQAEALQQGKEQPDNSEMAKLREERKRQARERKAEQQSSESNEANENKKDAVAAAVERAKARKAAQQTTPSSSEQAQTSDGNEAKKAAVSAAVERAKARKAAQQHAKEETSAVQQDDADDPKKVAIAAAVERAKARKANQLEKSEASLVEDNAEPADSKQAAVAAAVERAKARKAAQQAKNAESTDDDNAEPADPKKAAVAAAVERAKARKAAQQAQSADSTDDDNAEPADPKKAAVAAAVERAKARKLAKQHQDNKIEENK